jgi:hypothetical protein
LYFYQQAKKDIASIILKAAAVYICLKGETVVSKEKGI